MKRLHLCSVTLAICLLATVSQASQTLQIVGESFPPFKYEEAGKNKGIDIDVAAHIFTKLGIEHEIKVLPWKRCWLMLQHGQADVGLSVSNQQERHNYVYFPKTAVWEANFVAFARKDLMEEMTISSLQDIKHHSLRVGIVNGNSYYPSFWDTFPSPEAALQKYHPQLEAVTTAEQNFLKLAARRIDIFIIPDLIGIHLRRMTNLESELGYFPSVLFSKPYPNAFSKNSTYSSAKFPNILSLVEAYDLELAEFKKSAAFQAILDRYLIQ